MLNIQVTQLPKMQLFNTITILPTYYHIDCFYDESKDIFDLQNEATSAKHSNYLN